MRQQYADIIVDITHEKLDRTFQYRIPPELEGKVKEGSRVRIPFGGGNRVIEGYVIGLSGTPKYEPEKIKPVTGLSEGSVTVES